MSIFSPVVPVVRRWLWLLLAGSVGLLLVLLWLAPVEQTLGQSIKLVYLHGALVRTAIVLFVLSLPVNLVALVSGRETWFAWGKAISWTAVGTWLVHTLFSMITTYATWGVFIAWFEPRTRFTFNLAAVGLIVLGVSWLVANPRFTALAYLVLAGLTLALLPTLEFIQHPLDPIGASSSQSIRFYYTVISLVALMMAGLVVIGLVGRDWVASERPGHL